MVYSSITPLRPISPRSSSTRFGCMKPSVVMSATRGRSGARESRVRSTRAKVLLPTATLPATVAPATQPADVATGTALPRTGMGTGLLLTGSGLLVLGLVLKVSAVRARRRQGLPA